MKYSISREQHFFFDENQYIEFDGLLTEDEHKKLCSAFSNIGARRRDLSHEIEPIKAISHLPRLAKLASELTHKRPLRFGFDQLLIPPRSINNFYNEVCIQGLVCLVFLTLDVKESHAIFAKPVCDLALLPLDPEKRYFVIGWAEEKALYVLQPRDQYTHELKKHGYVFGDRLNERWHPVLTR